MADTTISGRAHVFGDDINTDYIIAGKYTKTMDYAELATHLLEDIDPEFASRVQPGDIIVAGSNFGCGSSREQAPLAIKQAGIGAVLAKSFSRIFFRNAINLGIPALACDTDGISTGDTVTIDLTAGTVVDETTGARLDAEPLAPAMVAILREGGLVAYLLKHGTFAAEE